MVKRKIPKLIIERAEEQGNFHFLSVIQYHGTDYLVVIDNITDEEIGAFVLDVAQQQGIDLQKLLSVIITWFYSASYKYPLSFEFSRLDMTRTTSKIYRTFELAHITRLIGKDFQFNFKGNKIRRRRVNKIPAGIEIHIKKLAQTVEFPKREQKPSFKIVI